MAKDKLVPKWYMRSWGFEKIEKEHDLYLAPNHLKCKHCKETDSPCVVRRLKLGKDESEFHRNHCYQCIANDEQCSERKTVRDPSITGFHLEHQEAKERLDRYTQETRRKNEREARKELKRKSKQGKRDTHDSDEEVEGIYTPQKKRKTGDNSVAKVGAPSASLAVVSARIDSLHDSVDLILSRVGIMATAVEDKDFDDATLFSNIIHQNEELLTKVNALNGDEKAPNSALVARVKALEKVVIKLSGAMDKMTAGIGSVEQAVDKLAGVVDKLAAGANPPAGFSTGKLRVPSRLSPHPPSDQPAAATNGVRFAFPADDEAAPFKFNLVSDDEMPEVLSSKRDATPRRKPKATIESTTKTSPIKTALGKKFVDIAGLQSESEDESFSESNHDDSSSSRSSGSADSNSADSDSDSDESELSSDSNEDSNSDVSSLKDGNGSDSEHDELMDTDGAHKASKEQPASITKSPFLLTSQPKSQPKSQTKATKSNPSPVISSAEEEEMNGPKLPESTPEEEMMNNAKADPSVAKKTTESAKTTTTEDDKMEEDELDPEEQVAEGRSFKIFP